MILSLFVPLLCVCWGSFLNVIAYRLTHDISFFAPRSQCPHCATPLAWYDLIPLFSWLWLRGRCRYCSQPISWLYPFIELLTVTIMAIGIITLNPAYWISYALFFSALIVTIRTDLETMLISRYATLALVPVGFLLSFFGFLPITATNSLIGALFGYFLMWGMRAAFKLATGKIGIGQGDLDLMALIGAFTGVLGCWVTLSIGSVVGALIGSLYLTITKQSTARPLPFGPFLALSACVYVFAQHFFASIFLGI
jgi:leader peptidase (prepilin peptidase)/N-methyltransferase